MLFSHGIVISGTTQLSTSEGCWNVEISLMHSLLDHDKTFELSVGPEHDRAYWTVPLDIVPLALSHPGILVEKAGVTAMAIDNCLMVTLPIDRRFVQVWLDASTAQMFVEDASRAALITRDDGSLFVSLAEEHSLAHSA